MDDDATRRWIRELRNDPAQQRMMREIEQETRHIRAKYDGVDVTTLDDDQWQEWLSGHHTFERSSAKGRRAQHRHKLRMARRAARSSTSNDPDPAP